MVPYLARNSPKTAGNRRFPGVLPTQFLICSRALCNRRRWPAERTAAPEARWRGVAPRAGPKVRAGRLPARPCATPGRTNRGLSRPIQVTPTWPKHTASRSPARVRILVNHRPPVRYAAVAPCAHAAHGRFRRHRVLLRDRRPHALGLRLVPRHSRFDYVGYEDCACRERARRDRRSDAPPGRWPRGASLRRGMPCNGCAPASREAPGFSSGPRRYRPSPVPTADIAPCSINDWPSW